MKFVILFILAVGWTWYLLTWLGSRREHRNVNSISSFSKHLSVLERTSPARAGFSTVPVRSAPRSTASGFGFTPARPPAMTLTEAQVRRRNVLVALAAVAVASLVAASALGGVWLAVHLATDVMLVGYVGLLARSRTLAVERAEKVLYLYDPEPGDEQWDDAGDDEVWDDGAAWIDERPRGLRVTVAR